MKAIWQAKGVTPTFLGANKKSDFSNAQWDENRKSVRFLEKNWNLFFSPEPQIRSCTDDIDYMRPASAASEAIS